jgi:hypothetical protein
MVDANVLENRFNSLFVLSKNNYVKRVSNVNSSSYGGK